MRIGLKTLTVTLITGAGLIAWHQAGATGPGVKRYVPAAQIPAAVASAPMRTGQCDPAPRPLYFYVMMNDFQEKFSEGKGMDELMEMSGLKEKSKTESEGVFHTYLLGMIKPNFSSKPSFDAYTFAKSDHVCIYFNQIQLDVSAKPEIYVADEISDPKCRQDVFSHERNHLRIYREDFISRGPDLKKHLEEKFATKNGWYVASGPDLDARIMAKYKEIGKEINDDAIAEIRGYIDAMAPRHASEVDNAPGEKERGALCLAKVPGLLKRELTKVNTETPPVLRTK